MIWPNENPLTPDRLAANGNPGAEARAHGRCGARHSPQARAVLGLTRVSEFSDATEGKKEGAGEISPRLTGNRCQCPTCGLPFSSVREFDRHRVGTYATPGQVRGNRRCLTVAELQARGWRPNARGFYMQPRLERAPAGISGPCMTLPATGVQGVMR